MKAGKAVRGIAAVFCHHKLSVTSSLHRLEVPQFQCLRDPGAFCSENDKDEISVPADLEPPLTHEDYSFQVPLGCSRDSVAHRCGAGASVYILASSYFPLAGTRSTPCFCNRMLEMISLRVKWFFGLGFGSSALARGPHPFWVVRWDSMAGM